MTGSPGRTGALAGLGILILALGFGWWRTRWTPDAEDCPASELTFVDAGAGRPLLAVCRGGASAPGSAGAALAVGQKLDLNAASASDLSVLPGVGMSLANAVIAARPDGGFQAWEDVDRAPGIGPTKLEILQMHTELRH